MTQDVEQELIVEGFENLGELAEHLTTKFHPDQDLWKQVEEDNPDFSFHQDVHLQSLLEGLTSNGLTEEQIKAFNVAQYGPVIDLYVVGEGSEKLYVMAVGQR